MALLYKYVKKKLDRESENKEKGQNRKQKEKGGRMKLKWEGEKHE